MIRFAGALLAFALAMPGAAPAAGPLRVVATTPDMAAFVAAVGGAHVTVESLAAPEQDAHALELKPAQIARLQAADLVVRVGLDHEPWLGRARGLDAARVLDLSRNVRLLQTETPRLRVQRKAHVHAFGNTHYWLDPRNAQGIASGIAEKLTALRPADAMAFAANRKAFLAELQSRDAAWDRALAPHRGARLVVMHDSWTYFAEHFGLRIVAAVEPTPGVPPSPAELGALIGAMREANVRVLVAEPHSDPAVVRLVAAKSGARVVTLAPSGRDYLKLMDENVARLAKVLGEGA